MEVILITKRNIERLENIVKGYLLKAKLLEIEDGIN